MNRLSISVYKTNKLHSSLTPSTTLKTTKTTTHPKLSGFTIVELLIVIVVIAILAAITIVAYNGIQTRAKAAATDVDLSTFDKKLQLHYTEYSTLPNSSEDSDELTAFKSALSGMDSKITWGTEWPRYSSTTTPHGKYYVYTERDSWSSYASVYYWDYNEGGWMRKHWGWHNGELNTGVDEGSLQNSDGSSPCTADAVESCDVEEL